MVPSIFCFENIQPAVLKPCSMFSLSLSTVSVLCNKIKGSKVFYFEKQITLKIFPSGRLIIVILKYVHDFK